MDALFVAINAKYIHTNNAVRLLHANSTQNTDYIEFTIHDELNHIAQAIISAHPKVIGISTYIWNVDKVIALINLLKDKIKSHIILGGPEVSYDPNHFLEVTRADVIIKGEAEHIIDTLITHLINAKPLKDIPNISTRTVHTPLTEITDLTTIKSPYNSPKDLKHIPNKIAYIEASRGCPYRCSYCLSSKEKTVRFFPTETVISHIKYLQDNGAKTYKFLDRTFNANKSMFAIIDYIINTQNPNQTYQFEITGDTLDSKIIDYIHTHAPKNLFRFEIGIQSTNEATNISVDRIQNNDKLFNTIKSIQKHEIIDLHLDLIAGLPKENLTTFKKTFNDVYALSPKELQLGFLKMLRGTKLRNQATLYNYTYNASPPYEIQSNAWLSPQDIATLKTLEKTLNTFHNKNHFTPLLETLINTHFDPFDCFLELYTHCKEEKLDLHHYQIDELFKTLETYLLKKNIPLKAIIDLRILYLKRSKVKPKLYFDTVKSKKIKQTLFTHLAKRHKIPLHIFYKHSIIIDAIKNYKVALYQNQEAQIYSIKKV